MMLETRSSRRAVGSFTLALVSACASALGQAGTPIGTLKVQVDQPGIRISPSLYGIFFEEINNGGDGGLYAELLRNRNFEEPLTPQGTIPFWTPTLTPGAKGGVTLNVRDGSGYNLHHLTLTADAIPESAIAAGRVGVVCDGYWGVNAVARDSYKLRVLARAKSATTLKVSLENRGGAKHGETALDIPAGDAFQTFDVTIRSDNTDPNARLALYLDKPGSVDVDYVSLMPADTFNGKPLRKDLAQKLFDLQPAFMRFPGGCWVEGDTMATASRWKRTTGPLEERWTQPNLWGYHSPNGLGYHEYLELCEQLKTSALFVINVGMSHHGHVPMDQMGEYVQDALDAIEYAIGPTDSKWGGERAKAGHPEPFDLKYIQIGNENGGPVYDERYALFYDAISAKYPQIKMIACDWGGRPKSRPIQIIDEHYYNTPKFFFDNVHKYDRYDRNGPKVYIGEYAVTQGAVGAGSLIAAVGEAAFMTGMERNSDIVAMGSYAPLFTHVNGKRWNPDLINFDNAVSYGTPSYHVQKMFSVNRGDVVLPVTLTAAERPKVAVADDKSLTGRVGLGTWGTQVEYKDFEVLVDDKVAYQADERYSGFELRRGEWRASNGVLRQNSTEENIVATVRDSSYKDCSIRVKARKTGGNEGFILVARSQGRGNYIWFNVGGWGNNATAIERSREGEKMQIGNRSVFTVEKDRWYDLRLDVKGDHIEGFVDGQSVAVASDVPPPESMRLAATASRDEKSGDVIVKFVNGYPEPTDMQIDLAGLGAATGKAKLMVLTGNETDENTVDAPMKVAPREEEVDVGTGSFKHTFPGTSVTVLRVPTK